MRRSNHLLSLPLLVAGAAITAPTTSLHADFVGLVVDQYNAESGGIVYHVIDIYADFDQEADRLLNVYDVELDLIGASSELFYNAEVPEVVPASGLPLPIILDATAYAYDSFVTIGALQGVLENGTLGDPSYVDAEFVSLGTLTGAGWYNLPPSNGFGDAGDDFVVLIGRFAIESSKWQSGSRIDFVAGVGYISDGAAYFGEDEFTCYYKPPVVTPPATPEDITGDSRGDLVWLNTASGQVRVWGMNGATKESDVALSATVPNADWTALGQGDVDGDGDPDLVLRDPTGVTTVWLLEGGNYDSTIAVGGALGPAWTFLAVADFDADGRDDLLFRNSSTNEVRVWLLDGEYRWSIGTLGWANNRTFLATADLDGDGDKDIVWRNSTTSVIIAWLVDGVAAPWTGAIANTNPLPPNWSLILAGDLDGDGDDDLVWRNANNGNVNGWLMDGASKEVGGLVSPNVPNAWQVVAALDLDNDGDDDIVWRNANSTMTNAWTMNGLVKLSGDPIALTGPNWICFTR